MPGLSKDIEALEHFGVEHNDSRLLEHLNNLKVLLTIIPGNNINTDDDYGKALNVMCRMVIHNLKETKLAYSDVSGKSILQKLIVMLIDFINLLRPDTMNKNRFFSPTYSDHVNSLTNTLSENGIMDKHKQEDPISLGFLNPN